MAQTRKMAVLTDSTGRILGLAHLGPTEDEKVGVGIKAMAGQAVHEVEVPEDVVRSSDVQTVHQWALHHYVAAGEAPRVKPLRELVEAEAKVERARGQDRP